MAVRTDIRDVQRHNIRRSMREIHPGEGAGSLPEGFCILVDDEGNQLVDDNGDILVALCVDP